MMYFIQRVFSVLLLICVTQFNSFSQTAGSNCASAVTLTVNSTCTLTPYTVSDDGTLPLIGCATGTGYEDGWFQFVATDPQTTLAIGSGLQDFMYSVFESGCAGTNIQCQNVLGGNSSTVNLTTVVGTTYFIQIQRTSAYGGGNASKLDLTGDICLFSAPPVCNDLVVSTTSFTQSGLTTCGAGDDFSSTNACGSSYMNGEDFVIEYTPNTTECIEISLTNTGTWTGVFLTDECPNSGTANCLGNSTSSSGNPTLGGMNVTAGQTYFITISTFPSPNCTPFDIAVTACPPPPPNDECAGAISVPVNPDDNCGSITSGTINNATGSSQTNDCYGTANDDVWYSFTATSTVHFVDLLNISGSPSDLYHSVYVNNCGSLGTALECSDANSSEVIGLTPGNTYFIRVFSYSGSFGANTTFDLCVGTPPPPPPNDECSGAISVPINTDGTCTIFESGTVEWATGSPQTNGCNGTANEDVWYSFTAQGTSQNINLLNVTGFPTDMYFSVYEGSCGSPGAALLCSDDNDNVVTGLTVGNQYFVRVYTYSSSSGATSSFDLCISNAPPEPDNITCANMAPICSGSTIAFTASSGGGSAPAGNNYDCLSTQPNPTWFYMEVDVSGNLSIDITAVSDVDYALWGPFNDLLDAQNNCGSYALPADCSYSFSATEQANIANVNAGDVYVLLVTNYADVVQSIFVSESSSNTASTDCSAVPLPVELISFEVKLIDEKGELSWSTASERMCDYYEIQRSADGQVWETIGFKKGNGNTQQQSTYFYTDKDPLDGVSYYRLKQHDFNGDFEILPVRSIENIGEIKMIDVFPNPASELVNVKSVNQKIEDIEVFSSKGAVVFRKKGVNENTSSFNCKGFSPGVYFIEVTTVDNVRHVEKLIVE